MDAIVKSPIDGEFLKLEIAEGSSIKDILEASNIPAEVLPFVVVQVNGEEVKDYSLMPKIGDHILLAVMPQGGGGGNKSILRLVAVIAVAWAAPQLAAYMLGPGASAAALSAATVGITMVGALAVNALIPPPSPMEGPGQTESTYNVTGQSNAMGNYAPVKRVYGKHKVFPYIAAQPMVDSNGYENWITAVYDFGYGPLLLEDERVGETSLASYGIERVFHESTLGNDTVLYTRELDLQSFSVKLEGGVDFIATSESSARDAAVDINFPGGLAIIDDNGNPQNRTVTFKVGYRKASTDDPWTYTRDVIGPNIGTPNPVQNGYDVDGNPIYTTDPDDVNRFTVTNATSRPFTVTARMKFSEINTYDIKVTRIEPDDVSNRVMDSSILTLIKTFGDDTPFTFRVPHTMTELKIKATDQINGVISNYSAVATSILKVNIKGQWELRPTNNPAWILWDILTGTANPSPLLESQLDLVSFIRFADFCQENKITFNYVIDQQTTIKQLSDNLLGACRATFKINQDGRFGVLIDQEQTIAKQVFTPANSWNFQANRIFIERPHCIKVGFVNTDMNWNKDVCMVYDDGRDASNSTKFEELDTFGCTSYEQAWKWGRYMLAQGIHRSETFSLMVDLEHLATSRGDLVKVAHDVPSIGGRPAFIMEKDGPNIVVSESSFFEGEIQYTVRDSLGDVFTGNLTGGGIEFTLDRDIRTVNVGDLIVIGPYQQSTADYIIKSIRPQSDLKAELELIPYKPFIYTADQGVIPPYNPDFTPDDNPYACSIRIKDFTARFEITHVDRQPIGHVYLDWVNEGRPSHASSYDLYWRDPEQTKGWELVADVKGRSSYTHVLGPLNAPGVNNLINKSLEYQIWPKGIYPLSCPVSPIVKIDRVLPDKQVPYPPTAFSLNVQSETIDFFWESSVDVDIDFYEINYSPRLVNAVFNASLPMIAKVPYNTTRANGVARTGTYFLTAIDTSGNRSEAISLVATVANLANMNAIETYNDATLNWPGYKDNLTLSPENRLVLEYGTLTDSLEGFYYYDGYLDLSEVYTSRVTAKLEAYGFSLSDTMSNWPTLAAVDTMATYPPSRKWAVSLEVASAKEIDPDTSEPKWSLWLPTEVNDFDARYLKFRIAARAFYDDVQIQIAMGTIEVDMPDRVTSGYDLTVPTEGIRIIYEQGFKNVPSVAISIDNMVAGDYYTITNKDSFGFNIQFFADNNSPVSRKFDYVAKGYGKQVGGLTPRWNNIHGGQ